MTKTEMEQRQSEIVGRNELSHLARMQWHLSPEGWVWFVSTFLRDVVAEEGLANRLEIESLVDFLSPSDRLGQELLEALDKLTFDQLEVLVEFHVCLSKDEFWQDYAGADISRALESLKEAVSMRAEI